MTSVSPGSSGAPNSQGPPRLPLRWAVIIGVTVAAGLACFVAAGISAAIVAAAAVAVALHQMLALALPEAGTPQGIPASRPGRAFEGQARATMRWRFALSHCSSG